MQHKIVLRAMLQIAVRHGAVETNRPTASAHSPLSAPMNPLIARDIRAARAAGYWPGPRATVPGSIPRAPHRRLTAVIEQLCLTWQ
ncbi:hypothetical protein [Nocardia sp. CA-120079]|uniref:hypothetical protein n=1 Tax=Nocardia sp. CA-120079 TaxID=3239974 RepID=UPI003D974009